MQQLQSSVVLPSGIQVVEQFFDAWRTMDVSGVCALISDDIEYHNDPFRARRGRADVEPVLHSYCRVSDLFEIEMHAIAERDGVVLTERTDRAVGPWIDMKFWICGTFEVRNGRITVWRDYYDTASVALELLRSPFRRLAARFAS